jgi:ankyrin repeat protein
LNTSLHLASSHGHLSIVNLLLDSGSDADAKNDKNMTPLDLSCRKNHFSICKNLIYFTNINEIPEINKYDGQSSLHLAAKEGEHEIVNLLLAKKVKIDNYNKYNMNCLDIAIEYEQREVIKVLLDNSQWYKLIRTSENNTFELDNEVNDFKVVVLNSNQSDDFNVSSMNSTLTAIFKKKLWDIFKIILDKCQISENEMNFSIIDAPTKNISKHPLNLIARSGQENLIKHNVTTLLLQLKWKLVPRYAFYFNLFFYLLYLMLFTWYIIELSMESNEDIFDENKHKSDLNDSFNDSLIVLFKARVFKGSGLRSLDQEKANMKFSIFNVKYFLFF